VKEDNLNEVWREASKHITNKKREHLKDKINELQSDSKNKNIRDLYRGINEFRKGYQPKLTWQRMRGVTYLRNLTKF
jgi:hypothetical protein